MHFGLPSSPIMDGAAEALLLLTMAPNTKTNAENQRAYRARKREAANTTLQDNLTASEERAAALEAANTTLQDNLRAVALEAANTTLQDNLTASEEASNTEPQDNLTFSEEWLVFA